MKKWLLFAFIFMSCQKPTTTTFRGVAMTIPYEITIGQNLSSTQGQLVTRIIEETFQEIDQTYNNWNPHSELSQLNAAPAHTPFKLSDKLRRFLEKTAAFVHFDAQFDPTIEPLRLLWRKRLENNEKPQVEELTAMKEIIGWDKIIFYDNKVMKKHKNTALDLGSIAKGYLVDLLTERLNASCFPDVFVEWGGEIRVTGRHPEQRPWMVGIAHFDSAKSDQALGIFPLNNQAIATSGDYLQNWSVGNIKYTHVFDPETLSPTVMRDSSIASATVIANDCMTADVLATMLLLARDLDEGKRKIEKMQQHFPHTSYFILTRSGTSYSTF